MKTPRIALVGNAHIDMIYRWRLSETLDRVAPETFRGVLDVMDEEPGLTYAQSQMPLYEEMERRHPRLFERIQGAIAENRWLVVGGKYVEADAMLPSGEALIRQFLVGQHYAREKLGVGTVEVAWVPDCFAGHTHTTPMIYAGCGIRYYVFNRGCPDDIRAFYWESPDGTRLFSYKIPKHYNLTVDDGLAELVGEWLEIAEHDEAMVLYGEGDHGGGPRMGDVAAIRARMARADFPDLGYDTPQAVLERAERERSSGRPWPVYRGDIGVEPHSGTHRGAYLSQASLKRWNRRMEHALSVAETAATIGAMCQRKNFYPRHDLQRMWKLLLLHQFHDTLPGTLIGDAADDVRRDYEALAEDVERSTRFGLEVIGSRIDTRGEGIPLVVYNPTNRSRTAVVRAEVSDILPPSAAVGSTTDPLVVDAGAGTVPRVVLSRGAAAGGGSGFGFSWTLDLLAEAIPPFGYELYRVFPGAGDGSVPAAAAGTGTAAAPPAEAADTDLTADLGARRGENAWYRVEWNAAGVTSIVDKERDTELLLHVGNTLELLEERQSSSWHVRLSGETRPITAVSGPEVVRNDALEVRVRWVDRTPDSAFYRELILTAGAQEVVFRLVVDWFERDALLKVRFPTAVDGGHTVYESPYGSISHPDDGSEWAGQNWISHDGTGPAGGLGVAVFNDGTYSFSVEDAVIGISVCRGARDMDPRMDEGRNELRYAIVGHGGSWHEADVPARALAFNRTPRAFQESRHYGELPNWGARNNEYALPSRHSFFSAEPENIHIGAVKVSEDDWNPSHVVIRLHETTGAASTAYVHTWLTPVLVRETNHIEDVLEEQPDIRIHDTGFSVELGAHQLRTFSIDFTAGADGADAPAGG